MKARPTPKNIQLPVIIGPLFILLHILASYAAPDWIWGAHHLRFTPVAFQAIWMLVAAAIFVPQIRAGLVRLASGWRTRFGSSPRLSVSAGLVALLLLFLFVPVDHQFLGDGLLVTSQIASEDGPPIGRAGLGSQLVYRTVSAIIRLFGTDPGERTPFMILNPFLGIITLLGAGWLSREIVSGAGARFLLWCGLVTPATLLFAFGYAEDYALLHVTLLFAFASAIRAMNGNGKPFLPLAILLLACFFHLSASIFLPLFLIFLLPFGRRKKMTLILPAAVLILSGIGAALILRYTAKGYHGFDALLPLFDRGIHAYTLFSPHHFLFLLNEMLLVLGGSLLLLFIKGKKGKGRDDQVLLFLGLGGLFGLLFLFLIDPLLGSRDWDLMALPAIPFTAFFGRRALADRRPLSGPATALIACLMVLHVAPWVAANTGRDRAVSMILSMVERDPHYGKGGPGANRALGNMLFESGYTEIGRGMIERSLSAGSDVRDSFNAGVAAARAGDSGSAVRWFKRAVDQEPEYERAYEELAALYLADGRLDEAITLLRRRTESDRAGGSIWYLLGIALGRAERVDDSIEAMENAVARDSTHVLAWGTLGVGYVGAGRVEEGRQALERALKLDPSNTRIRQFLETLPDR